jgi:hypothetical protein
MFAIRPKVSEHTNFIWSNWFCDIRMWKISIVWKVLMTLLHFHLHLHKYISLIKYQSNNWWKCGNTHMSSHLLPLSAHPSTRRPWWRSLSRTQQHSSTGHKFTSQFITSALFSGGGWCGNTHVSSHLLPLSAHPSMHWPWWRSLSQTQQHSTTSCKFTSQFITSALVSGGGWCVNTHMSSHLFPLFSPPFLLTALLSLISNPQSLLHAWKP